jgi:MAF protein
MSTVAPRLLLASASPRRRELLGLIGLPFGLTRADIDETPAAGEPPVELVARLSSAKARAARRPDAATVLACDTVVVFEGAVMGKPSGPDEATAMLHRLRAREHVVLTAISLLDPKTQHTATDVARTALRMRSYTAEEVAAYVATGDPLDKAGAYAIQHEGFHPVADFDGCYANVVGLPLCHLAVRLRAWGVEPRPGLPDRCQKHTGRHCTVFPSILSPSS